MRLRLKEYRDMRGLSLRALAKRLDTSAATLCRWETGKISPTMEKLERYAAALEVDPFELFVDAPTPSRRSRTTTAA